MADRFRLRVDIQIEGMNGEYSFAGERLSVREEFEIPAGSFTEVAGVLGQFHELARKVKAEADDS